MRFSGKIYLYRGRVNDSFSLDSIAFPILCVSVHITTFLKGVPIRKRNLILLNESQTLSEKCQSNVTILKTKL